MCLFNVCSCLGGREVHRVFYSVKDESNHLLLRVEVSISRRTLLCRDRFLAIRVVRHRGRGEDGMNAMDGCPSNSRNVLAIFRLGGGITKVIHIHLEELGGRPCSTSQRYIHYRHGFVNGVMRKGNQVIHTMLCDVSGCFRHCAEMGRALDLPHLNSRRYHNPAWLPC